MGTLLGCVAATASEADVCAGEGPGVADAVVIVAANDLSLKTWCKWLRLAPGNM